MHSELCMHKSMQAATRSTSYTVWRVMMTRHLAFVEGDGSVGCWFLGLCLWHVFEDSGLGAPIDRACAAADGGSTSAVAEELKSCTVRSIASNDGAFAAVCKGGGVVAWGNSYSMPTAFGRVASERESVTCIGGSRCWHLARPHNQSR